MQTNPYQSPSEIYVEAQGTSAILHSVGFALKIYALTIACMLIFGSVLFACDQFLTVGSDLGWQSYLGWWYDHGHGLMVAPPLLFALSGFIYLATGKKCRADVTFAMLLASGIIFLLILDSVGLRSPRYLKGADPLVYPIEIWGYVVPYCILTIAVLTWYRISPHRKIIM